MHIIIHIDALSLSESGLMLKAPLRLFVLAQVSHARSPAAGESTEHEVESRIFDVARFGNVDCEIHGQALSRGLSHVCRKI